MDDGILANEDVDAWVIETGNEEEHSATDARDDASHRSDESGSKDTDVSPPFTSSESGLEIAPVVQFGNSA